MTNGHESSQPARYQITVKGSLDPKWSAWFDGFAVLRGENDETTLTGLVADVDGARAVRHRISGPAEHSEKIGRQLAETLLAMGAGDILATVYGRPV